MMHKNRTWHITKISGPEGLSNLARDLRNITFVGCQGFEIQGEFFTYLLLNDSTGPDGTQEYAVMREDSYNLGMWLQIESYSISWMSLDAIKQALEDIINGDIDAEGYTGVALRLDYKKHTCALCA